MIISTALQWQELTNVSTTVSSFLGLQEVGKPFIHGEPSISPFFTILVCLQPLITTAGFTSISLESVEEAGAAEEEAEVGSHCIDLRGLPLESYGFGALGAFDFALVASTDPMNETKRESTSNSARFSLILKKQYL